MWNKIYQFIVDIEPLLLVIVPTIFGIYLKIRNKITAKNEEIKKQDKIKNSEIFIAWEHEASMNVVEDIKNICNYYKDIGHADLVNYIQLENGTLASSKVCNMFISCLAEDNRFSNIPKMMPDIQRVPYTKMSAWVNDVRTNGIYSFSDMKVFSEDYSFVSSDSYIKSCMSCAVKNGDGVFIGMCTFFFTEENFSGIEEKQCEDLLVKFATSVETVFINYNKNRRDKIKELKIEE